MITQMTINLPPEKVRQYLSRYFETRSNIEVKHSEPHFVQLHDSANWINVKIEMLEEEEKTRLTFNFDFRMIIALTAILIVVGVMIICYFVLAGIVSGWLGFVIGPVVIAPYVLAYQIGKIKRDFPDDIRKVFYLLDKTD